MIEKKTVGSRLYYVDNDNNLMFTKTEMKSARKRYAKKLSKKIADS